MDIELEDTQTWPKELSTLVFENKTLVISYHSERESIFLETKDDPVLRTYPPDNSYEDKYKDIVAQLTRILMQHNIIGYHCTRLTSDETKEIAESGMQILSCDLITKRLSYACQEKILSESDCKTLLKNALDNNWKHRAGMIWFCPNRSTLKEEYSVFRLFRSWSGEAVYCGYEEDENIGIKLRSIGMPCIIKCTIPLSSLPDCSDIAERFLSFFVSDEIEYPEPTAGFDMPITRNLLNTEVLEIINIHNNSFEELTNYKNWDQHYSIL